MNSLQLMALLGKPLLAYKPHQKRRRMIHQLKVWPTFIEPLKTGLKTWEIRRNDRNYKVGDFLVLHGYDPKTEEFIGEVLRFKVTYLLDAASFPALKDYVVMSITKI